MCKIKLVFVILMVCFIFGCSKRSMEPVVSANEMSDEFYISEEAKSMDQTPSQATGGAANNPTSRSTPGAQAGGVEVVEQKRIRNGSISITVDNIDGVENAITLRAKEFNGYISSSVFYINSGNMAIKIPADRFDQFINGIESIGEVTYRSITEEDVTQRYYDLQSRINSKRILKNRYEAYLARAANVTDLLEIEQALNSVISELDSIETQMRTMEHSISYSTLNIAVSVKGGSDIVRTFPSLPHYLKGLWSGFVRFLFILIVIIAGIILFGSVSVVVVGLLYYVTFGKLGLIKKFFRLLSSGKASKGA